VTGIHVLHGITPNRGDIPPLPGQYRLVVDLRRDARLSWPSWHNFIPSWYACPRTVTHPSINRAWRTGRVTSFVRRNDATATPNHQLHRSYTETVHPSQPVFWLGSENDSNESTRSRLRGPVLDHHISTSGLGPVVLPITRVTECVDVGFSLNGELMMDRMGQEIAFKGIDLTSLYVPAFSLSSGQHARVNFGQVWALWFLLVNHLLRNSRPFRLTTLYLELYRTSAIFSNNFRT